jgi:hypothetical protein
MRLVLAAAAALALASAAGLAGAPGTTAALGAQQDVRRWYSVVVPPGWSRTAGVSCPLAVAANEPDCFEVGYYRGPLGQWLRVAVDPPGEPEGYDAVLPAQWDGRGRIDPLRTIPPAVAGLRAVAVTATARGRRYVVMHGGGSDGPVDVEGLRAFVWSLEPR